MADRKTTELVDLASPAVTDLLYVAADPGGVPVPRKATVGAVVGAAAPKAHDNTSHVSTYITASDVTYGNLNANGDVGTGADQVAQGNHTHAAGTRYGTALFTIDGEADIATGKLRIYNKSGLTRTITRVWAAADTAPVGDSLIVDIHLDGTTIHTTQSNRAQIAAGTNYDDTATIEVASWADGHYLTMDCDQVGSGTAGSDVTVGVEYTY